MYVIYPIGCFLSGILQEKYGKKLCMIISNIPSIIGWILVYYSYSSVSLCIATLLMGFSSGFGAGSTSSYIGEIAEPRLRGTLGSMGSTAMWIGSLSLYILDSYYCWRTIALLSLTWPIFSTWFLVFVCHTLFLCYISIETYIIIFHSYFFFYRLQSHRCGCSLKGKT